MKPLSMATLPDASSVGHAGERLLIDAPLHFLAGVIAALGHARQYFDGQLELVVGALGRPFLLGRHRQHVGGARPGDAAAAVQQPAVAALLMGRGCSGSFLDTSLVIAAEAVVGRVAGGSSMVLPSSGGGSVGTASPRSTAPRAATADLKVL